MPQTAADQVEDQQAPTPEFLEKHDIIKRAVEGGGNRRLPKHEALLRADRITPQECAAGNRWIMDYLIGIVGKGRCSLDTSVRSSGGDGSDHRLEATGRHVAASAAIDRDVDLLSACGRMRPSDFALESMVIDRSYTWLGGEIGQERERVPGVLQKFLRALAAHYAAADRAEHRDSTPGTKEMMLKSFEPENEKEEEEEEG